MKNKELPVFQNYRENEEKNDNIIESNKFNETVSQALQSGENDKKAPSVLEILIDELNKYYRFVSLDRQLYVYDEAYGYWRLIPASNSNYELRLLIPYHLRSYAMKVNFSNLYEWLLVDADRVKSDFFKEKWNWINFSDCAYNFKDGSTTTKRGKLQFRYALNVDYPGEEKTSGEFEKFVDGIFSDKKTKKEFYKFLAICFGNIRTLKVCCFLYGVPDSGKTTMLNVIKYILGEENCSSLSFSQFNNEFALTQLLGKRANLSGEVSGIGNKKLDVLKSITGNDTITASFKCKDHFQYQNQCIIVFACNSLPHIDDYLEAQSFLSRVIIFPFSKSVKREKWDDKLLYKLINDVPGIFDCVRKGFKLLEADKFEITESDEMKNAKLAYAGNTDSFSVFSDKYISSNKDSKVLSAEIQEAYSAFCNQKDFNELPASKWAQVLKRNFACQPTTVAIDGKRCRAYKGIKLRKKTSEEILEKEAVVNNASNSNNSFLPITHRRQED